MRRHEWATWHDVLQQITGQMSTYTLHCEVLLEPCALTTLINPHKNFHEHNEHAAQVETQNVFEVSVNSKYPENTVDTDK